jgi:hypothetical protein
MMASRPDRAAYRPPRLTVAVDDAVTVLPRQWVRHPRRDLTDRAERIIRIG